MPRLAAGLLGPVCAGLLVVGCAAPAGLPPPDETVAQAGWSEFVLPGKRRTHYRVVRDRGQFVVRAEADASASMLRRPVRIEPSRLGRVEFSWRIDDVIADADLGDADRSDSPVRVLFAFDGDRARLSLRNRTTFELAEALTGEAPPFATLMYVWDNRAEPETLFHSHRTDRVRKIVVESGAGRRGRWLQYRRDLVADYRRAFGEEPGRLIGVALMTDADNTGSRAAGEYGEVRLFGADGGAL
ncbi:MAG: DUF3047 domain-containing protein [Piscinibacter sp.]|nr:DUF3047 domain-containing protein [Piscinibacter sp.]